MSAFRSPPFYIEGLGLAGYTEFVRGVASPLGYSLLGRAYIPDSNDQLHYVFSDPDSNSLEQDPDMI
jgi:hypothetical protein